MARLELVADQHSMRIETNKRFRTLTAIRTGPGFPPRITATATRDTPGSWNNAAKRLHDSILAGAVPNGI
jgi:hypothetical protein